MAESQTELPVNAVSMNTSSSHRSSELQRLRDKIKQESPNLIPLMKSLKALERQESETQSKFDSKRCVLEAEVIQLEAKLDNGSSQLCDDFDRSLCLALETLNLAKKELAARLRETLMLKRKIDDMPSHSELIQYDRRSSELNVHIQNKLRQTRKYYATYNALLEIKELMLKETSLLNSISGQFQEAITSPAGRAKLIESMEAIVKSSQQKLQKVQTGFQDEQKVCDALKTRYNAAIAEQRRCYSLLKTFQEECTKNERLGSQSST
ncbi:hypothetical protein ACFE04_018494 [Oxalis oulophora]